MTGRVYGVRCSDEVYVLRAQEYGITRRVSKAIPTKVREGGTVVALRKIPLSTQAT